DGNPWPKVAGPAVVAVLTTLLTVVYFSDYSRPAKHPASHSLAATLDGTAQFLSVGFGGAANSLWPASRWGLLAMCLASVVVVGYIVMKQAERRGQALRLMLFAAAQLSLAVGTSWARVALHPGALFASRYALLAALFWCAVYLSWELLGPPQLRRFFQLSLCLVAASLLVANYQHGK